MSTTALVIMAICVIVVGSVVIEQIIKRTRATIIQTESRFEPNLPKNVFCRSRKGRRLVARVEGAFVSGSTGQKLLFLRRPRHRQVFCRWAEDLEQQIA